MGAVQEAVEDQVVRYMDNGMETGIRQRLQGVKSRRLNDFQHYSFMILTSLQYNMPLNPIVFIQARTLRAEVC